MSATVPELEQLSINQITVKSWDLPQTVEGCARAGIGWVGLWLERIEETGPARTAKLLAQHDMRVSSVCRAGFFTGNPDERCAAQDANRKAVELTAEIGADVLYLVCGGVPADRDLPAARATVAEGLAALVPFAHEHGVRLAVEPLHPILCGERSVVVTLAQALELCAEHPSNVVGLAVDSFNVWWDPELATSLERARGRVISYQVCDWLVPLPHPMFGRGLPGDGVIDFGSLANGVADAGYSGPVEVEIFNEAVWATDPDEVLSEVKKRFPLCLPTG